MNLNYGQQLWDVKEEECGHNEQLLELWKHKTSQDSWMERLVRGVSRILWREQ